MRPAGSGASSGRRRIGEIELAAQFLPGPIVAITGSNGKTTTTTLAGEIIDAGGLRAAGRRQHWHPCDLAGGAAPLPTRSLCWKFQVFSWKPFRLFGPKLLWFSTSLLTTLTAIARSPLTPTPRRASSKISGQTILPCSMPMIRPASNWQLVRGHKCSGSAGTKK